MARSYWSGAITFAGFPIAVKAYNVQGTSAKDKLKSLCPCHKQPIKAPFVCAVDGTTDVGRVGLPKGFEAAKGTFVEVPDALLNNAAPKTEAIDFAYPTLVSNLSLDTAKARYRLLPGSPPFAKSIAIMWHTLNATGIAMIGQWTPRDGGKDSEVAVFAAPDGLALAELLSVTEQSDAPVGDAPSTAVTDAETAMFRQAIDALYGGAQPYDPTRFSSQWQASRNRAIEAALNGTPIEAAQAAAPAPAVPDLMAALQASLDAAKATA